MSKPFFQLLLLLTLLIILILPIFLTAGGFSFTNSSEFLFLIHRLLGIYAFSLIFIQIILGSLRDVLNKFFPSNKILKFHMSTGKIAFLFSVLHPSLLLATYFTEKNLSYLFPFLEGESVIYFSFGILALVAMFISVLAAIFRLRIGPKWIYLHRLNYLIFWLVFFHSAKLGVDVHSDLAAWMYRIYGAIVAVLTARRIYLLRLKFFDFRSPVQKSDT